MFFLDEFDAVAKERADVHETGEIKRVVSSLLLQLDRLPSHVVVCAATNHPELLDRAVWRRFQMRVHLPTPTRSERTTFLALLAERYGADLGLAPRTIADKLGVVSYAELQDFVLEMRRRQILALPDFTGTSVARDVVARWHARSGGGFDRVKPESTMQ